MQKYMAIWDTGATASVVTQAVANAAGLKAFTMEWVNTSGGRFLREVYLVNVALPNGVGLPGIRVTQGEIAGADVLIGMDIITLGDLSVTNENGETVFSFRMPSQHTIDFVKDPHQRGKAAGPILRSGMQHGQKDRKRK